MSIRSGLPIIVYKVPATVTAQATGQFAEQQILLPRGTYLCESVFNFICAGGNFTGVLVSLATASGTPVATQNIIFRNSAAANGLAALPAGAAQTIQNMNMSAIFTLSVDTTLYFNIGAAVSAGTWGAPFTGLQNQIVFSQIGSI
jgi:hypothetical protein